MQESTHSLPPPTPRPPATTPVQPPPSACPPPEAVGGAVAVLPLEATPGLVGEDAVGDVGADVGRALRRQQPLALYQGAACGWARGGGCRGVGGDQ